MTGIAVIDNGVPVHYEAIDLSKDKDPEHRTKEMFLSVVALFEQYRPDCIAVEGVQKQANDKTMIMLSGLRGMLMGWAYTHCIPVVSPMPVEWRRILGYTQGPKVKREQLKEQSINYVREHYGIIATEDECEAICIGAAMYQKLVNNK